MAEWFFDPGAAGTGSGSSAANAFVNPNSWFALQNSAGGLTFGDRVWFRRTSQASMVPSSAFWGRSGWIRTDKQGWFIGWPRSGDPFYDVRPGDARSAGWDADVNTYVNTDINWAVWIHSGDPHPSAPTIGWGMANLCIQQVGGATSRLRANSAADIPKRSLHYINTANTALMNVDGITITHSHGNSLITPIGGGKITLSGSTMINTAVFPEGAGFAIEELIINTNSVQFFHSNNINAANGGYRAEINRVSGNKPWGGPINTSSNRWNSIPIIIYDYYGEGPFILMGAGWSQANYMPSSAHAQVNSMRCLSVIDVVAQGGTNYVSIPARGYGEFNQANADARALVNVTSGVPIHVRWPLLNNGSMNFDPVTTGVPVQMIVRGPGGRTLYINSLAAGAVTSWSGASVSAGSAWSADFSWTPTATGSHMIDLLISRKIAFSGKAFIGHPRVSSS